MAAKAMNQKEFEYGAENFAEIKCALFSQYWCQMLSTRHRHQSGPGTLIEIHVSQHGFPNKASDWLVVLLSANQMPGLKISVN